MSNRDSIRRIVAAFQRTRLADQPPGARQQAKNNATPINKPKGIDKVVVKENGAQVAAGEDTITPQKRDIQPKDVFPPTPNNMGVYSLAETGRDLSKAIKQVKKDKGHDVVYNLSQYLIRTDGNGGAGTEEGKK